MGANKLFKLFVQTTKKMKNASLLINICTKYFWYNMLNEQMMHAMRGNQTDYAILISNRIQESQIQITVTVKSYTRWMQKHLE